MRAGPKVRAKRQKARDARARAGRPITAARIARGLECDGLSGAVLEGRQRNRRIPAHVIRQRGGPAATSAVAEKMMKAYSGGTSLRMRRAGLGGDR